MDTKTIDDGGPAFPGLLCVNCNDHVEGEYVEGMTLRDWFAGMSMPAIIAARNTEGGADASSETDAFSQEALCTGFNAEIPRTTINGKPATYGLMLATDAYELADAMIQARKQ